MDRTDEAPHAGGKGSLSGNGPSGWEEDKSDRIRPEANMATDTVGELWHKRLCHMSSEK